MTLFKASATSQNRYEDAFSWKSIFIVSTQAAISLAPLFSPRVSV